MLVLSRCTENVSSVIILLFAPAVASPKAIVAFPDSPPSKKRGSTTDWVKDENIALPWVSTLPACPLELGLAEPPQLHTSTPQDKYFSSFLSLG